MFAFATAYLSDAYASDVGAWIEANIKPSDVFPLAQRTWGGIVTKSPILDLTIDNMRPVRINTFWWPWGASRFARAHFIATEAQLAVIRPNTYRNGAAKRDVLIFADGGEDSKIAAQMWMLPPLPLATAVAGSGMYLITLVDDRYWWWGIPLSIVIPETMAWTALYAKVAQAIGKPIAVDPIVGAYGSANADYSSGYGPLPAVLDAIAFSVQQRIVIDYENNSIMAMNVSTAASSVAAQLAVGYRPFAGGKLLLTPG